MATKEVDESTNHRIDQVVRRIEQLQKTMDLLYDDRNILEQILGGVDDIKTQLSSMREHDVQVKKDIKEDIAVTTNAVDKVDDKIGEVQKVIEKKKFIKVNPPKSIFKALLARFGVK